MVMRMAWLAPVATLLMLRAHPSMTTLSVALGASDTCGMPAAVRIADARVTAATHTRTVVFILALLD
jgi:hypothetical protein